MVVIQKLYDNESIFSVCNNILLFYNLMVISNLYSLFD